MRETWGAVLAAHQAAAADDAALRALMEAIAPDELGHAELAAELAAWYATRLSAGANARVAQAKREAIADLERAVRERPAATALTAIAGLPAPDAAARLLTGLRQTVWADALATA